MQQDSTRFFQLMWAVCVWHLHNDGFIIIIIIYFALGKCNKPLKINQYSCLFGKEFIISA